MKNFKLATSN